jgi:uncharacterized protein YlxW (UPF0749 family)
MEEELKNEEQIKLERYNRYLLQRRAITKEWNIKKKQKQLEKDQHYDILVRENDELKNQNDELKEKINDLQKQIMDLNTKLTDVSLIKLQEVKRSMNKLPICEFR